MTTCNRDLGRRFLAGALGETDEPAFINHLDTCESCQRWLEQESGDDAAWKMAKEMLSTEGGQDRRTEPAADDADGPRVPSRTKFPELAYLHPSDDPAMLGRLGSLEVIGMLGRGGMGIVFKCFDPALRRNVAVKLLDPVLAHFGAARQRFAREARAMAAISHEHVVPIYAVHEHAELPYLVMEYVPGGTLERRLLRDGALDVIDVIRVSLQIASALAAAHRQGLVHRDIKPSNVLLDPGTERVRVTDFGLARAANDGTFTRTGTLAGTPQYMAPEQVRGEACDAQSDLFSLGSVMYTLCVGHPPFRGENVYAVMHRIVHDEPRSLREQNANVPDWLEDLVFRLLAKDKSERFNAADEVVKILELELAYRQNPKTLEEPARSWRRSMRHFKVRKRPWLWAAGIGLAIVSAVAVGAWWRGRLVKDPEGRLPGVPVASLQISAEPAPGGAASGAASGPASAVLWESDGFEETAAATSQLERAWREESWDRDDPWLEEAAGIRRRIGELSTEQALWRDETP
jgi:serine/threonine-protein kinase